MSLLRSSDSDDHYTLVQGTFSVIILKESVDQHLSLVSHKSNGEGWQSYSLLFWYHHRH